MKRLSFLKIFVLIAFMCGWLCSCHSNTMLEYYAQKENYINVTGTVSNITYNDDATTLYIDFSEVSPVLDDTCFKIVGQNLKTVKAGKIDDKLKVGERITFITAPKYFGDGYVMPIVAISIHGESLLIFEQGYENLLDWLCE